VRDGAWARLDTGEGNARSPVWSPDGTSLVFENNRTGLYKLYRIPLGTPTFGLAQEWLRPPPATPLVRLRLSDLAEGKCPDLTGHGHGAVASGDVPKLADGGVQCGEGFARIDGHKNFAFDRQAFYVTADVFIEKNPKKLQLIVVGDYPEHHLGWQLYVDPNGRGCFSSRDPAGTYVGARTEAPIPAGKRITMTGVRDSRGTVSLLVRGEMEEDAEAIGATMAYGPPNQIRIGSQFNGGDRFQGRLYEVEVGTGIPAEKRKRMLTVKEVLGE
jgi:hypothetical protein